jgi:endonuclease/exonuclease/phosphatase family metal-dependent hydrolase
MRVARAMGDFDVLCLQEVARNFPGLPGSAGENQFALFEAMLPGFQAIEGIATDTLSESGGRKQFGNLILTRLPVLQAFRHMLPWPADAEFPSMQRCAVEVVLQTAREPLRVTTTHLEYYSRKQREAQVEALRKLQEEASGHAAYVESRERIGSPFQKQPRPASSILTADFNFQPTDPSYSRIQAPLENGGMRYHDAWKARDPVRAHSPTLGLFDKRQWPEGSFACDFIFVTEDLLPRVDDVVVESVTDASDHQPVMLTLAD